MITYCLNIIIPAEHYDQVLFRFINLGMTGCEEQNAAEGLLLKVYFNDRAAAQQAAAAAAGITGRPDGAIDVVEPQDWNAVWRKSMKPACLSRGWWVSPLWLPPHCTAKQWIKIEPKMAFGTGHHETTRLAAQALISRKKWLKGRRVLDLGTGSGVLCFVADCCGASQCLGAEIDPCCRENLAENLLLNAPSGRISFCIGSTGALKHAPLFDLAVMNMILTESAPLLSAVRSLLKPEGLLVWSGILADEHENTTKIASAHGFSLLSSETEKEWWCGVFRVLINN
jgi:ribosomal protein L11 methyltransferase